jgi:hypothetical protein
MDRKAVEGIKDGALMELDDGVRACCVKRQCYIRFSRGARDVQGKPILVEAARLFQET